MNYWPFPRRTNHHTFVYCTDVTFVRCEKKLTSHPSSSKERRPLVGDQNRPTSGQTLLALFTYKCLSVWSERRRTYLLFRSADERSGYVYFTYYLVSYPDPKLQLLNVGSGYEIREYQPGLALLLCYRAFALRPFGEDHVIRFLKSLDIATQNYHHAT